jgi:DNA (cytosine-5)-methyltransferase 1
VDLFCGAGGLTHGFIKEGFQVVAGVDSDTSCKFAFEHNNDSIFIDKKIEELAASEILALYPDNHIKILVGCAPCQPFSSYTKKKSKDDKWKLLSAFADRIDEIDPDIVSMENVRDLVNFRRGTILKQFVDRLESKYTVTYYLVYCPDYGIPQSRTRLVLFASKFGAVDLIEKTHSPENYPTVADVISNLEPIEAGQVSESDPLHRSSRLDEINLRRIKQSVPGGTWRDWDEDLVAACHKKSTGRSYPSVYGRMKWDEPSPTITTQSYGYGNGRFGHPDQNRAISLREAALLQTFPDDYEFVAPDEEVRIKTIGRHIGNAVPVDLGRVIAKSIAKHIEENNG